jgi:branched-chain amino acid transport system substrate-binding protein
VLAKTDMKGVMTDHFAYDQYGDLRDAIITVYKCENGQWKPQAVLGSK